MLVRALLLALAGAALAAPGPAQRVLKVPAHYATIQAAIDVAKNTDTVLVAPGTYTENLDFKGKAITVKSSGGPRVTTIDGGKRGSVVTFKNGEGLASVIEGFTITNGSGTTTANGVHGGGIFCRGASPTIRGNVVTKNAAGIGFVVGWGGGISCEASSALIAENVISQNTAQLGGGIYGDASSRPRLALNLIDSNTATERGPMYGAPGGGFYLMQGSVEGCVVTRNVAAASHYTGGGGGTILTAGTVVGTVVLGNQSTNGAGGLVCVGTEVADTIIAGNRGIRLATGGLTCRDTRLLHVTVHGNLGPLWVGGVYVSDSVVVTNSIVWNNSPSEIVNAGGKLRVTYSDVKGGFAGAGNINADPRFVDPASDDFHLRYDSPCRDRGTLSAPGLADARVGTDFEGDPRIADGLVDMGADEFFPHLYHVGSATPGGTVQVRVIGKPGGGAIWGFSVDPRLLSPPLRVPGLSGSFLLRAPFFLVPLGSIPASGVRGFGLGFPSSFPVPASYPTQALIGLRFSNPDVVRVQ